MAYYLWENETPVIVSGSAYNALAAYNASLKSPAKEKSMENSIYLFFVVHVPKTEGVPEALIEFPQMPGYLLAADEEEARIKVARMIPERFPSDEVMIFLREFE